MIFLNVRAALTVFAAMVSSSPVWAQAYPSEPVTLVVPFAPGGGVDLGARDLATGLSKLWNQPVVVENVPGAGSQIGTGEVAAAKADGYTILYDSGAFTTLPAIRPSLPYDPAKDFQPVTLTGDVLAIIVAGPSVKAQTMQEFIEEAKTREVFYTTSGSGSSNHLLSEAINLSLGLDMKPVHYKSGAEALVDVAGGRADIYAGALPAVMPLLADGKVRLLATAGRERTASYPDVPTLSELGYDNAQLSFWWGIFVPDETPDDIVKKLNADVKTVLEQAEHKEFLDRMQTVFYSLSTEEFEEFISKEIVFWKEVVEKRGIAQE